MTTTTIPISRVLSPTQRRTRRASIAVSGVVLALALASLGTWLALDRAAESNAPAMVAGSAVPLWPPISLPWLQPLVTDVDKQLVSIDKQLVDAGYSIKADGKLDPVKKSALADYLRPNSTHPPSASLAPQLEGTVITGLRNPAAWNKRFGLDRKTTFVERPLTGAGGQLDANGNIVQR
jgi:hypothetical protein